MEELTKERAHDLCVEMWNEIAENGYTEKRQSYLIQKYNPDDEGFACHFYIDCNNCIFTNLDSDGYPDDGCTEAGSPYQLWVDTKNKKYAIAVAELSIMS